MMRQSPTRRRYRRRIETFQLLHVAGIGCQKPSQGLEQSQDRLSINGREVSSGFDRENDPLRHLVCGVFRRRRIGHLVEVVDCFILGFTAVNTNAGVWKVRNRREPLPSERHRSVPEK